jgi:hypothetical protein
MDDNQQKTETPQELHLRERILQMRQEFEAFFKQMEETIQDPTVENLTKMRDQVFENGESEFELGSMLSKIISKNQAIEDGENDELDEEGYEDFERAEDLELFVLIEECFTLLQDTSEFVARLKKYQKHILLELEENDELPRALSGLHDALIEKLESLLDVTCEF